MADRTPVVLLHGALGSRSQFAPLASALESRCAPHAFDFLGHGGSTLTGPLTVERLVEQTADYVRTHGLAPVALFGYSLGGYVALQLAARGRARTVVAFAPAGGWARGDESYRRTLGVQRSLVEASRSAALHAEALVASPQDRRRATQFITTRFEHIPAELLAHQIRGVAGCDAAFALIDHALREGWSLDAEKIACPVRIVWGTDDALLPWPAAAARFRDEWLPHADWVELDGVGHCPQLDVPLVAAQLILGFT